MGVYKDSLFLVRSKAGNPWRGFRRSNSDETEPKSTVGDWRAEGRGHQKAWTFPHPTERPRGGGAGNDPPSITSPNLASSCLFALGNRISDPFKSDRVSSEIGTGSGSALTLVSGRANRRIDCLLVTVGSLIAFVSVSGGSELAVELANRRLICWTQVEQIWCTPPDLA